MSYDSSVNSKNIGERDSIELYFAYLKAFSINDEGVKFTIRCVKVHLKNDYHYKNINNFNQTCIDK